MSLDIEFIGQEKYIGRVPEPIPAFKKFLNGMLNLRVGVSVLLIF